MNAMMGTSFKHTRTQNPILYPLPRLSLSSNSFREYPFSYDEQSYLSSEQVGRGSLASQEYHGQH